MRRVPYLEHRSVFGYAECSEIDLMVLIGCKLAVEMCARGANVDERVGRGCLTERSLTDYIP